MTEARAGATAACRRLARAVGASRGWRRAATAFGAGVLAAAALPPVYALPALLVSLPVLIWLIDGAPGLRRAFADGWWFGFGHFVASLYWIGLSLLVDAARFAWLLPFAVLCIPAAVAVYVGIASALARAAGPGWPRLVALAAAWTLAEWARGRLLTGFPWNATGIVWTVSDATMQLAAVGGVFLLSLVAVLAGASPAMLAHGAGRRAWLWPAGAIAAVAALWAGGQWRLAGAATGIVPGVTLRIVQPDIPQRTKWLPAQRDRHLATYLRLSATPAATPPTHLIWPESAVPFIVALDGARRRAMASVVPTGGLLLTGAIRTTPPGEKPFRVWNSLHAIDRSAGIVATYDKFHLVPFGEYIPFSGLLGLTKITAGRTDFSAGPGPTTLDLPGLPPVSPLICYEIIFPEAVTDPGRRPRWLLNVTNDAWFGTSSGPFQHFAMARLRAVEQGLPLVRAANTGISALVDPYGRTLSRLGLNRKGILDGNLPREIARRTPYSLYGDLPILIVSVAMYLMAFWISHRAPARSDP